MIYRHSKLGFPVRAKGSNGRVFLERRCECLVPLRYRRSCFITHYLGSKRWSIPEATFRRLYTTLAGRSVGKIPRV